VSHAGRDAIATDNRRSSNDPGSGSYAPSAEEIAAAQQRRARHLALLLMAASATIVLGVIGLLWWFT
jgi:hypothetical protein